MKVVRFTTKMTWNNLTLITLYKHADLDLVTMVFHLGWKIMERLWNVKSFML